MTDWMQFAVVFSLLTVGFAAVFIVFSGTRLRILPSENGPFRL